MYGAKLCDAAPLLKLLRIYSSLLSCKLFLESPTSSGWEFLGFSQILKKFSLGQAAKVLWQFAMFVVPGTLWIERRAQIFKEKTFVVTVVLELHCILDFFVKFGPWLKFFFYQNAERLESPFELMVSLFRFVLISFLRPV